MKPESVPSSNVNDDMRALDQSEKEYNRMISQHVTYHKLLMDDLMKLSSESGSGSSYGTTVSGPRELLQQQINQANQANIVGGIGTTIRNLNASDQGLLRSASNFVDDTTINAKTVSRLNNFIKQNATRLNKDIDEYQALISQSTDAESKEGFDNPNQNPNPNPTLDAALEVSTLAKESNKYALFILGLFATFVLYKTIKHL